MISVIIPVYQEAKQIISLLNLLATIRRTEIAHEIICVDGGSQDGTAHLIQAAGYSVIQAPKGRGHQLRKGVAHAQGDVLWFLHADTYLAYSFLPFIEAAISRHPLGAFSLAFVPEHVGLWLIAKGSNWRVDHRSIAFGDQGMFMKRSVYEAVGGFRPLSLMEDYDLSLRLKAKGYRFKRLPQTLLTSARRFQTGGTLTTLLRMQYCQALFRRGVSVDLIR